MSMLRMMLAALLAALPAAALHAGPLDDYVARPDPSYAWQERRTGRLGKVDWTELRLVSQTWRDTPWRHQLYVLRPAGVTAQTRRALLFIGGGRWKADYDGAPDATLPSGSGVFAELAERLATPVAVLRQVPFQPIFGLREDDLIAHTFDRYLETGDADWPLLLPMVKSAVRAMDAVQAYAADAWDMRIDAFTVTGASKRGWTTWLTAAVDPRVAAFAPMVIDIVNIQPQLEHQQQAWGSLSSELGDYTRRDLQARLSSEAGRALRDIVDPYSYRQRLVQPKLVILATNDRYWPVDALNLYWQDLPAPKNVLYVSNEGHGLERRERVVAALQALHAQAGGGAPLPQLDWKFSHERGVLGLSVTSDVEPTGVVAWVATAPTRDFRNAWWKTRPVKHDGNRYTFDLKPPPRGYAAVFAELAFDEPAPYRLSSGVQIVAGAKTKNGDIPRFREGVSRP